MNNYNNRTAVWAVVTGALALLAGCDAVKDVRSEPATELPRQRVTLTGTINGLGGGRAITLRYHPSAAPTSFIGADPAVPTDEPEPIPFSFGALEEGTPYSVEITSQPYGKQCQLSSGQSGTLAMGQAAHVVIDCVPNIPRHDLVVTIPPTPEVFSGLPGAKITLYTGEQMREATVTPGQTQVTFPDSMWSAAGQPAAFTYTVSASFIDPDGRESRCRVTNATGSNPTSDVTNVIVGLSANTTERACQFTMRGSVEYNAPPGGIAETGALPGGLLLEVRDTQGNVRASHEVSEYGIFTVGGEANPTLFSSNVSAVYDVVVARQPEGRACVVGDGGAVSFYRSGTFNPSNVEPLAQPGAAPNTRAWGTRLNIFCRALPAAERVLAGTYRLTSSTWTPAATASVPNPVPITARYDNYDWTVQNVGSSNMLTFFDNGTFLYGSHGYQSGSLPDFTAASLYTVQVEHGFYDYDPVTGTLQFTLITDTNPSIVYPTSFGAISNVVWNAARTGTPGLSAAPGAIETGVPVVGGGIGLWTAVMNNVQKSTITFGHGRNPTQQLSRITGRFGSSPSLDWELTEPQSLPGEMTGTWVSKDYRRFWVWDYLTYYGTHVGVANGAPSMNDACFTMASVEASHGIYTRRGTSTGCYPYNRPARGTAYLFGFSEAADFHLTDTTVSTNTFVGVASLGTRSPPAGQMFPDYLSGSRLVPQFGTAALAVLPGFVGRIPGGQSAADGRSPSPVLYLIAPAANFAAEVASRQFTDIGEPASRYFDNLDEVGPFDWCPTEVLGIRASLHGNPIDFPVYFCRTRAQ
jgi:hypothetical protein